VHRSAASMLNNRDLGRAVKQDLIDGPPGGLHAVRTGLSLVAFIVDLWLLTAI
jgi:hypothetical protein